MDIIIMKIGGTCLTTQKKKKRIVELINNYLINNELPILVVSAIGRYKKPYATDTLLSLLDNNYIKNNLQATDLLMSCGEIISSVSLSSFLSKNNIKTIPLTGGQAGIITDNNFSNAKVIDFNDSIINKYIKKNIIPIVCGFQGITKDGFITTLGRGGSDTTATILGNHLGAKRIDIYKDVDGIMTSDPKKNNKAVLIEKISYDKAFNILINGAKVLNKDAIFYAKEKNIPIHVKNLFGDKKGTIIN
jgi:aspartate kinase